MSKKKIEIEVDPVQAVAAIGLIRSIFPSIIEQLNHQAETNGADIRFGNIEPMQEVFNEIYNKCIAETDIHEYAQAYINSMGLDN